MRSYKERAWGKDEVQPNSGGSNNRWGGMGMTLVDSLDTLYLFGFMDEFNEAKEWVNFSANKKVRTNLSFDHVGSVSLFETNIRILGGLLSAYSFTKDEIFKNKAVDIGNRLMKGISGRVWPSVNQILILVFCIPHKRRICSRIRWTKFSRSWYVAARIQVKEYANPRYLSYITKNMTYENDVMRIYDELKKITHPNGLIPINISFHYFRKCY